MIKSRHVLLAVSSLCLLACSSPAPPQPPVVSWEALEVGFQSSLRGLSAVDEETAWVSGSGGSFAFTRDGGDSWQSGTVPDSESLDFRDVQAFADGTAYLMSAGPGDLSRIYKTSDWGQSWSVQHVNPEEAGFFNGMAFWDSEHGMVVGDPVDGDLFLLATSDGGQGWERVSGNQHPRVMEGEYGFAASGTNIATFGEQGLVVASGGPVARVFRTPDRGKSWEVVTTPMASGNESSGIFSIAYRDPLHAMTAGGDYQNDEETSGTLARSADGGLTWTLVDGTPGVGFRSAVAWRNSAELPMWVAVGTSGSSYSIDDGLSWTTFEMEPYNAVAFGGSRGWAAGPQGRVARLLIR
jgi:photosystem II stability/assembly factor-like uncharacterized protein